jgi:hypothetical protein
MEDECAKPPETGPPPSHRHPSGSGRDPFRSKTIRGQKSQVLGNIEASVLVQDSAAGRGAVDNGTPSMRVPTRQIRLGILPGEMADWTVLHRGALSESWNLQL